MSLTVSGPALQRWLAGERPRPFLLDVRQPWEFALVRLDGSILIPLDELEERLDELPPAGSTTLVTVCHHGVRSLNAAHFLAAHGHDALSLSGGLDAWAQHVDTGMARY